MYQLVYVPALHCHQSITMCITMCITIYITTSRQISTCSSEEVQANEGGGVQGQRSYGECPRAHWCGNSFRAQSVATQSSRGQPSTLSQQMPPAQRMYTRMSHMHEPHACPHACPRMIERHHPHEQRPPRGMSTAHGVLAAEILVPWLIQRITLDLQT